MFSQEGADTEDEVESSVPESLTETDTPEATVIAPGSTALAQISQQFGIDSDLMESLIDVESAWDVNAGSGAGAQGLTQIMPAMQKAYNVTDPYDPVQSVRGGANILSDEMKRFKGDEQLALAAYNAGSPAVFRALRTAAKKGKGQSFEDIKEFLPQETQAYVPKILSRFNEKKNGRAEEAQDTYQNEDYRQAWGTPKDFALEVEELATKPGFARMPVKQQIQEISRLYDSRKWVPEVDTLVSQVSDELWNGAAQDERVDWASQIGPAIEGDNEEALDKSKLENIARVKSDLKSQGINPSLFGSQIDNYFEDLATKRKARIEAKNRGFFGSIKAGGAEILRGAAEGYTNAAAAVPDLAGYESTGTAVRNLPTKVFGEHRDFDFELNEDGSIKYDEDGKAITRYEGMILRGFGQIGSILGGGALLKAAGYTMRGISVFMGGTNTLSAMDQAYAESREEGASRDDALTSAWIAGSVAAPASLLDAAVFSTHNYWLKGLTGGNRARAMAQIGVQAAAAGAAGNTLTEAGVQAGVGTVTGKPFSSERLKIAAGTGAVAGGFFGGLEGRGYQPPLTRARPTGTGAGTPGISQPPEVTPFVPPPEAPAAGPALLPPPGERLGLPRAERERSGPTIPLGERPSPEAEVALAQRFEEFQKTADDRMVIEYSDPEQIPQDLLRLFGFEAQRLSDKEVAIVKRETHQAPVVEGLDDVTARIQTLSEDLDSSPHPDRHADLVLERSALKKQQYDLEKQNDSLTNENANQVAREIRRLEEEIKSNRYQRRRFKDPVLHEVLDMEHQQLQEQLAPMKELLETAQGKLIDVRSRINDINESLRKLQDPLYVNNMKAKERELTGLLAKRGELVREQRGMVEQQPYKDVSIKVDTPFGDRYAVPFEQKWYVFDGKGKPLTAGDWTLKDALTRARQLDRSSTPDITPQRAGTSPRAEALPFTIQRGKLNVLTAEGQGRLPGEVDELRTRYEQAQKGGEREIDITKPPGKPGKKAKGPKVKPKGAKPRGEQGPDTGHPPEPEGEQPLSDDPNSLAALAASRLSDQRIIPTRERRPAGPEFVTSQPKAATGPTPAHKVQEAAQGLLGLLSKHPVSITQGGPMRRGVLGYYQFRNRFIRMGRIHDVPTMVHEVMHAVDDMTIGHWDRDVMNGNYDHLPPEVKKGLIDTAEIYYPANLPSGNIKIAEGFTMFLQHLATGQKVHQEVLDWFNTDYKAAFPKEHAAIMRMVEASQEYFTQPPEDFTRQFRSAERPSLVARVVSSLSGRNIRSKLFDTATVLKEADKLLSSDLKDSFDAQRNTHDSRARYVLNERIVDLKGNTLIDRSFADIVKPVQDAGKLEELADYMVARRALAYRAAGLESGLNLKDATETIRGIEQRSPEVVNAAHDFWDAWDTMIAAWSEDSTATKLYYEKLSKGNLAETGTTHGYYVPFSREGKGDVRLTAKRTGSTRRILNPLGEIGAMIRNYSVAIKKQQVLEHALLTMSRNEAGSELVGKLVREITDDVMLRRLEKETEGKTQNYLEGAELDPEDRATAAELARYQIGVFDPPAFAKAPDGYEIVSLPTEDGTRYFEVHKDVTEIFDDSISHLMRHPVAVAFGLVPKKILQTAATTLRPAFIIRNFARDSATLWRRSDTWNPLLVAYDIAQGLSEATLSNVGMKSFAKWADLAERTGARNSTRYNQELYNAKLKGKGYKVFDTGGRTWNAITNFLGTLEEAPRLGAMMRRAKELNINPNSTLTDKQAVELILAYKRATTDFSVQGRFSREVNRLVPFFTARIAETSQSVADFKRRPAKAATELLGWIALGYSFAHAHKDDDWYQNLDPIERMHNVLMPIEKDGDKRLLQIPLTTISKWGYGIGQAIGSQEIEQGTTKPEVSEWMGAFVKDVSPVPIEEATWQGFAEGSAELTGPLMKEVVQQLSNRDFYFNKTIVPRGVEHLQKKEQITPYTSELAKSLGEMTDWSPVRIDHAIRSLVPAAMDGLKAAEKRVFDKALKNPSEGKSVADSLVNVMLRYELANATFDRSESKFYDALEKFQGNKDEETPEEGIARKQLGKIQQSLSDIRVITTMSDISQQERDQLYQKKSELLEQGMAIAGGKLDTRITPGPKAQAKAVRTERKQERSSALAQKNAQRPSLFQQFQDESAPKVK